MMRYLPRTPGSLILTTRLFRFEGRLHRPWGGLRVEPCVHEARCGPRRLEPEREQKLLRAVDLGALRGERGLDLAQHAGLLLEHLTLADARAAAEHELQEECGTQVAHVEDGLLV